MNARRKKTYLALLGVGAIALLVDRVFLSSPVSGPELAAGDEITPVAEASSSADARADVAGIPELPFPSALERYAPTHGILDLFAIPALSGAEGELTKKTDNEKVNDARELAAQMAGMLQGVLVQGNVRYAVLDGRAMKPGQNINGCTIAEISGTRVRFLCADLEVIATVPTSADR